MRSACKCGATTLAVAVGVCLGVATPARAGTVLPAAREIEGTVVTQRGSYLAAELFLKRAIAIDEKALGPEHPDLAGRLNNLAVLYWATAPPDGPEPLFARALAILEERLPLDHPALAAIRENYTNLLRQLGYGGVELRIQAEAIEPPQRSGPS